LSFIKKNREVPTNLSIKHKDINLWSRWSDNDKKSHLW